MLFHFTHTQAGVDKRIGNFSSDIKDSEAYTHLIKQIAPSGHGVDKSALQQPDLNLRAEKMLQQAEKIGCRYNNILKLRILKFC